MLCNCGFKIENEYIRKFLAEFFGTFLLCLLGNSAVHSANLSGGFSSVHVALAYGLAVSFGIYVSAGVSGGHINPAVTIGMFFAGNISILLSLVYFAAQFLGAFVSSAVVYFVYVDGIKDALGKNNATDMTSWYATAPSAVYDVHTMCAFFDQIVCTFIFVTIIFAVVDARNVNPGPLAPLLIGLAAVAVGLAFGGNAGGAINPARDFGPRLFALMIGSPAFAGTFWLVPLFAPLIGGALAAVFYYFFISAHWPEQADYDEVDLEEMK